MCIRDRLEAAANADGVVFASPVYLGTITPQLHAFVERLVFPFIVYDKNYSVIAPKRFETAVIYTMNVKAVSYTHLTRAETQDIADKLCDIGFRATAIHGDMSQRERNNALSALRGGRVSILVATDVAARGLDIDAVSHVLQLSLIHI